MCMCGCWQGKLKHEQLVLFLCVSVCVCVCVCMCLLKWFLAPGVEGVSVLGRASTHICSNVFKELERERQSKRTQRIGLLHQALSDMHTTNMNPRTHKHAHTRTQINTMSPTIYSVKIQLNYFEDFISKLKDNLINKREIISIL